VAAAALFVMIVILSWWPVRNLASPRQAMNASFNPFRLVNTYGAFGSVSRERIELVIEGTAATTPGPDADWREYGFKGKPDDPARLPPQVAPYHLRLDWLLWFIPLSPRYGGDWFVRLVARLLEGDRATLGLLRQPIPRCASTRSGRVLRYRFTTWASDVNRSLVGSRVRVRLSTTGRARRRSPGIGVVTTDETGAFDAFDAVVVGGGRMDSPGRSRSPGRGISGALRGGPNRGWRLTLGRADAAGFVHDVCSSIHTFGRTSPFLVGVNLESARASLDRCPGCPWSSAR
jgi:hypothetical protein